MNVGSLFSGIGGIELGFERAGCKTLWFVEKDEFCQKVLKKHFPHTNIYSDVEKINWKKIQRPDILTGGFPCQDISIAGKGEGIEKGKNSSLWNEYAKAIRILRPKYALIENVPNIANLGLNIVLSDLAKIGYHAEWFCIRASTFGAWHKRERLFVLAYTSKRGSQKPSEELEEYQTRITVLISPCSRSNLRDDFWQRAWPVESTVCGVSHGIPHRMDRVGALGNSVVPQVAYSIAKQIMEWEHGKR